MEIDDHEQESPATFKRKNANAKEAISTAKEVTKTLEEKNSSPKPKHDIKDKVEMRRDSKEKLKPASSKKISNTGTTEVAGTADPRAHGCTSIAGSTKLKTSPWA